MVREMVSSNIQATNSGIEARISFVGATMFVILLALLHLLKPELEPSWRFISEYALGRYGWVMVLAFLALAVSFISLFVAIRAQLRTITGRIGLLLLLISAAGLTIAAIFTTDPITTSADAATLRGNLHNLGGTLGIAMPFAAALISWSLVRNPLWAAARQPILWAVGLAEIGFVVSFVSLAVMVSQSNGVFGPTVLVGWPTRFEIVTMALWLMTVAWQATKLQRSAELTN